MKTVEEAGRTSLRENIKNDMPPVRGTGNVIIQQVTFIHSTSNPLHNKHLLLIVLALLLHIF